MSSNKSDYRILCKKEHLPLQMQPFWWDAVCGEKNWDVALSKINNGEIIGALPYFRATKFGFSIIKMPPLTTYNGPWIKPIPDKNIKLPAIYGHQKKVVTDLIAGLPETSFYRNHCLPNFQNHLPFHWKGFNQTTRYTYQFRDNRTVEQIYAGLKRSVRTDLKKAESANRVEISDDVELLHKLSTDSFRRQNMSGYDFDVLKRLDTALSPRGQRTIYIARSKLSDEPIAGLYVVHDEHSAHCLISGQYSNFKENAAVYLLFWEAIKTHFIPGRTFDFEGSMLPKIEHFLRSFGGELTPYSRIYKSKNKLLGVIVGLTGKF